MTGARHGEVALTTARLDYRPSGPEGDTCMTSIKPSHQRSIGHALDANNGVGPGFDTVRVVLAFSVIAWHCFPLTLGSAEPIKDTPAWVLVYAIVPMFFALSGFLVTGSALRLKLAPFVASRALRIVPALVVDTAVSILIFGVLFTTLPAGEFLTHPETLRYWLNAVGEIHLSLPGVFKDNPNQAVNGSLWTIPPELGCYFVMAILIATGLVRKWPFVLGALIALFVISGLVDLFPTVDFPGRYRIAGPGFKLVAFFLMGSLAYLLRHRIPLSPWLAGASVLFVAACAAFGSKTWWDALPFEMLSSVFLTYLVIWFGMTKLPTVPFFDRGDYSYGIYLYGFPMQQALIHLSGTQSPFVLFLMTVAPVTLLAMFSWHVVEKPTLRLRKKFSFAGKVEAQRAVKSTAT